jgi:hypothetical protein
MPFGTNAEGRHRRELEKRSQVEYYVTFTNLPICPGVKYIISSEFIPLGLRANKQVQVSISVISKSNKKKKISKQNKIRYHGADI